MVGWVRRLRVVTIGGGRHGPQRHGVWSSATIRGPGPVIDASGWRWRRARHRVARTIWIVPTGYVVVAIALSITFVHWDEQDPIATFLGLSASSASAAMAALGSGMIAFTGFVTSVVLVIVQFGSTQFSQRFVRWFRNDSTLKHALGTFIATFLFALIATAVTGSGPDAIVPTRTLLFALVLALASVGWFIALITHTMDNLRVAHVTQVVSAQARLAIDAVYPDEYPGQGTASGAAVLPAAGAVPVQELRHRGVGATLVSLDRRGLVREAAQRDAVIRLVVAVGDHLSPDSPILQVHGPRPIPERRLRGLLSLGDERTIEDDPAFALRLLVDVAGKALSAAVNDPTTAVQSLHRIEDVLRYAATKRLSSGVVTDATGEVRLLYPTPSWADLVALALDEIRAFGAGQYQIARRMRALLDGLLTDLPADRHPALLRQRDLLDDAVERLIPAAQREDALVADPQGLGLGGSRQDSIDRTDGRTGRGP
jgi:uncharacterized membrane protein